VREIISRIFKRIVKSVVKKKIMLSDYDFMPLLLIEKRNHYFHVYIIMASTIFISVLSDYSSVINITSIVRN